MGKFIGWLVVIGICVGYGSLQIPAQDKKPDKVLIHWEVDWAVVEQSRRKGDGHP